MKPFPVSGTNPSLMTGIVIVTLLVFVLPIPHTVSVRDFLFVLTLGLFGVLAWRAGKFSGRLRDLAWPLTTLSALLLWAYVAALAISPEPGWSLDEINHQLLKAAIALCAGMLVAHVMRKSAAQARWLVVGMLLALLAHVFAVDLHGLYGWLSPDQKPETRYTGLTDGPDKASYVTNLAFSFLLAEGVLRLIGRGSFLPIGHRILGGLVATVVLSVAFEGIRNGTAILAALVVTAAIVWALIHWRRTASRPALLFAAAGLLVVSTVGITLAAAAKPGANWRQTAATIPFAWNLPVNAEWFNDPARAMPRLPNGDKVDESAFMRVIWLREGLALIGERPLGYGFGRNAFGHAMQAKYGGKHGHSHSSTLDLTIGLGIPGLILWVGFAAALLHLAWRAREREPFYALLLLFLVIDFNLRMLVDSNQRDHMFQQFMFLAGAVAVLSLGRLPGKNPS